MSGFLRSFFCNQQYGPFVSFILIYLIALLATILMIRAFTLRNFLKSLLYSLALIMSIPVQSTVVIIIGQLLYSIPLISKLALSITNLITGSLFLLLYMAGTTWLIALFAVYLFPHLAHKKAWLFTYIAMILIALVAITPIFICKW